MATVTASMTASMAAAVAASMAILGDRLWLKWLQFELRNLAFAAAGPHTGPLSVAFLGRLLTALATWVVDASPKFNWKCHCVAVTASTTSSATVMTAFRASKATATVATSTTGSPSC